MSNFAPTFSLLSPEKRKKSIPVAGASVWLNICMKNYDAHGFQPETIDSEDWGWCVPIRNDSFNLWIGCGNQDDTKNGFLCFIIPDKPEIRKLFKKINTTAVVLRLADALDKILTAEPGIHDIHWESENR
jgi:hypothetical protein